MSVNVRKSACMRIGPRFNVNCSSIVTNDGQQLSWCENIRYLGVYVKAARQYGCVFSQAKRSYYRAFNAVYGKDGSLASSGVAKVQRLGGKARGSGGRSPPEADAFSKIDAQILAYMVAKN